MSFWDGLASAAGQLLGFALHPASILETLADGLGLPDIIGKGLAFGGDILLHDYPAAVTDGVGLLFAPHDSSPKDRDLALTAILNPKSSFPLPATASAAPRNGLVPTASNSSGASAVPGSITPSGTPIASLAPVPSGGTTASAAAAPSTGANGDVARAFFAMSDEEIIRAINENRVPPEVLHDQGNLLVLQQRIYGFNESVTLLTNLLRSVHEMHMQIIGQLRA